MFNYFGYGSNMRRASLASKGVHADSVEPATLENWRLTFNIGHPFEFEGNVANVEPAPGAVVHGALYRFSPACLDSLDRYEGYGVFYDRHDLEIVTYTGTRTNALVYVGTPRVVVADGRPSERYRNILLQGARELKLADDHLRWLASFPTYPLADYPPFAPPHNCTLITSGQLARQEEWTALAGHVFDMSEGRANNRAAMLSFLSARDATAFMLRFMDSSAGDESLHQYALDHLSNEQRSYLNRYLHEFTREYRYVGRLAQSQA
ncbi:MAG: gamma-glutamylcyclotransferase family protein [Pseudomonadota bacterium]